MPGTVQLAFGCDGARAMAFVPLTGDVERALPQAAELLRRLASAGEGLVHGAAIDRMTVGDRDRALAALYAALYSDDILADAACTACSATYEIRFTLSDLSRSRSPDGSATGDPPGVEVTGSRLRLPLVSDLTGSPATLLERLTLSGPAPDAEAASAALEAADPALELDLAATCPECQSRQTLPFSISRFLEAALCRDQSFLAREVHLIASTYHWSLTDILGLSRSERQTYVRLVLAEREAVPSLLRRVS
jgi:hypothetical protein